MEPIYTEPINPSVSHGSSSQGDERVSDTCTANKSTKKTTMLLFGKTGSGKSATGNTILGKEEFKASPMCNTTKRHQIAMCKLEGENVILVDTPDVTECLEDPNGDPTWKKEVARWKEETKDGIDALLLVHKYGARYTDQHKTLLTAMEKHFGKEIFKHTIVIFTHGDQIEKDKKDGKLESFETYLTDKRGGLPKLMEKVDFHRYVVFNNECTDEGENKKQVQDLMEEVKRLRDNQGPNEWKPERCNIS